MNEAGETRPLHYICSTLENADNITTPPHPTRASMKTRPSFEQFHSELIKHASSLERVGNRAKGRAERPVPAQIAGSEELTRRWFAGEQIPHLCDAPELYTHLTQQQQQDFLEHSERVAEWIKSTGKDEPPPPGQFVLTVSSVDEHGKSDTAEAGARKRVPRKREVSAAVRRIYGDCVEEEHLGNPYDGEADYEYIAYFDKTRHSNYLLGTATYRLDTGRAIFYVERVINGDVVDFKSRTTPPLDKPAITRKYLSGQPHELTQLLLDFIRA